MNATFHHGQLIFRNPGGITLALAYESKQEPKALLAHVFFPVEEKAGKHTHTSAPAAPNASRWVPGWFQVGSQQSEIHFVENLLIIIIYLFLFFIFCSDAEQPGAAATAAASNICCLIVAMNQSNFCSSAVDLVSWLPH